jgi:DNA-binding IclR family transcriptional regulator
MQNNLARYPIKSLEAGVGVLFHLSSTDQAGVRELSATLGLTPSRTHRILETLRQVGLVEQDPRTHAYRLGYKLFELGTIVARQRGFVLTFRPYLQELAELTGETVKLAIADQGKLLYLDVIESNHILRISPQVGTRAPLHCTAMGKVLLAFGRSALLEQVLASRSLRRFTPRTIVSSGELQKELELVRAEGYAIDNEEYIEGSRGLAAPIEGYEGTVEAALSISGPSVRLPLKKIRSLSGAILALADKLSTRLRSVGEAVTDVQTPASFRGAL